MQQYQRFVDELAPRLETARALERQLDAHLARRFNVFDYLRRDELGLSRIVADLLNPAGKHGQGASFLKLLLDGCDMKTASPEARTVEIEVEKAITENRRLDICVRIGGFCLAIENKPYAGDQPDQIRAYLEWLRAEPFEKYALIYLSPSGEPPSSESVEPGDLEGLDEVGHFKIMPYDDGKESESDDGFDRCDYTLAEWFADCRKNCRADRLWWFLREAEEFCKRRFGGETVTSGEIDTISDFVVSDEKTWEVGLAVHRALPQVMRKTAWDFIRQVARSPFPEDPQHKWPDDIYCRWDYSSPKKKSCLGMYSESWKSTIAGRSVAYSKWEKYTQVRLEAWVEIDQWDIGVRSDNPLFGENEKAGIELRAALTKELGNSESNYEGWVWWQKIDDKYRNWSSIVPALRRELRDGGGDATMYFLKKFAHIFKIAGPIIDQYESPARHELQ